MVKTFYIYTFMLRLELLLHKEVRNLKYNLFYSPFNTVISLNKSIQYSNGLHSIFKCLKMYGIYGFPGNSTRRDKMFFFPRLPLFHTR
jgi:hypothetical protein